MQEHFQKIQFQLRVQKYTSVIKTGFPAITSLRMIQIPISEKKKLNDSDSHVKTQPIESAKF